MWSPEGYYSWSEVLEALFDVSRRTLSLVCKGGEPSFIKDDSSQFSHTAEFYLKNGGFAEDYPEAELIVGITTTMLLVTFIEQYPPALISLEGNSIRANAVIFGHRDQLELCYFDWPVKGTPEFYGFFKSRKEGRFDTESLLDRFAFIDTHTGEIRHKNGGKHYLVNGLGLDDSATEAVITFVQKVSGYLVCWPEFPEGQELRDFLSCLEANEILTEALNHEFGPPSGDAVKPKRQKKGIGRPSRRDEVSRAYWSHFPEGHSQKGKSWKEALAIVNDAIKVPVSEDTLKRAVNGTQ